MVEWRRIGLSPSYGIGGGGGALALSACIDERVEKIRVEKRKIKR
jgi:hypothetical protein